jgi:hypothetical protein
VSATETVITDDEHGDVVKHVGNCRGCDYVYAVEDGSYDGFKKVQDQLCRHIGHGSPCHDFYIEAEFESGVTRRV